MIDESKLVENGVSEETVESWCVEEQAMEMDIAVLQQVEELERKVTTASLQVKVNNNNDDVNKWAASFYYSSHPYPLEKI